MAGQIQNLEVGGVDMSYCDFGIPRHETYTKLAGLGGNALRQEVALPTSNTETNVSGDMPSLPEAVEGSP